jgi:hypothetical protein
VLAANKKASWPRSDGIVFEIRQIHKTRMLSGQISESLRVLKRIVEAAQIRPCVGSTGAILAGELASRLEDGTECYRLMHSRCTCLWTVFAAYFLVHLVVRVWSVDA